MLQRARVDHRRVRRLMLVSSRLVEVVRDEGAFLAGHVEAVVREETGSALGRAVEVLDAERGGPAEGASALADDEGASRTDVPIDPCGR